MNGYAVRDDDVAEVAESIGEGPLARPSRAAWRRGTAVHRDRRRRPERRGPDRDPGDRHARRRGYFIAEAPGPASYVRPAGGDFRDGQLIARAGDLLTPARLGLAAAANQSVLEVRRQPRVAILASGDELREPGSALAPGVHVNSAAYALAELVAAWGGALIRHEILSDDPDRCAEQICCAGLDADIILPLGGASVGERDCCGTRSCRASAQRVFERIAVQPGSLLARPIHRRTAGARPAGQSRLGLLRLRASAPEAADAALLGPPSPTGWSRPP